MIVEYKTTGFKISISGNEYILEQYLTPKDELSFECDTQCTSYISNIEDIDVSSIFAEPVFINKCEWKTPYPVYMKCGQGFILDHWGDRKVFHSIRLCCRCYFTKDGIKYKPYEDPDSVGKDVLEQCCIAVDPSIRCNVHGTW